MRNDESMMKPEWRNGESQWLCHLSFGHSLVIRHSDFVILFTTLSHRSHKSGCALLVPTVGRWRQQRAHFLYGVFVTETLASFAWWIVRSLTMKNSSSSSLSIFSVTSESEFNTTRASSVLPISFS